MAANEGGKPTDKLGTLNLLLAQRLELALILANRRTDLIGIIENASAVAQTIPHASHLSKGARQKLFERTYPLAWGADKVVPDAFVTGVAEVSQDLRVLTISLQIFDRQRNLLEPLLPDFTARIRPDHLVELGESFVRGALDEGRIELKSDSKKETASPRENEQARLEVALGKAVQVKQAEAAHPAQDPHAPLRLEVLYDRRMAPITVQDGVARVAEPREGQEVQLVLRRGKNARGRMKAVVKVNGENTFDKQRLPDAACWGWVLDEGPKNAVTINGYHIGPKMEKFRVLSQAESRAREISYGPEVGTITVTVFGERTTRPAPLDVQDDEAADAFVVSKSLRPSERKSSFDALKSTLLADANRGLIAEGQMVESGEAPIVKFDQDPLPVMVLTIVYYKPSGS
jgi:hypothetical protein